MPAEPSVKKITFAGEYLHALDGKNRLTIPAAWRQQNEAVTDEFFIVPHVQKRFLMVMPPDEFNGIRTEVKSNPDIPPSKARQFLRQFYGEARNSIVDRQGRLVLSEEHCKAVGLQGEVMMNGIHGWFEIWTPEKYAQSKTETNAYEEVGNIAGIW